MLATSLSSLLLLLAHLSGSSAKHISFGSNHDNLLLHRALRRSVDGSPSGTAAALAAPSSAGTPSTPSQASDVQTNYDWDGVIDLSSPPPANLTESAADQEKDLVQRYEVLLLGLGHRRARLWRPLDSMGG
jgi:hypothetical protein